MDDRPHNYQINDKLELIYCQKCGTIAFDRKQSATGQFNTDQQRISKQACPRAGKPA